MEILIILLIIANSILGYTILEMRRDITFNKFQIKGTLRVLETEGIIVKSGKNRIDLMEDRLDELERGKNEI